MIEKYIVTSTDPGRNTGGNKAKNDIINIASKRGYQSFVLRIYKNKLRRFFYVKSTLKRFIKNSDVRIFILQYPVVSSFVEDNFINYVKKLSNANLCYFIHDLPALQNLNGNDMRKEIDRLNSADLLIAHNEAMKQWLISNGVSSKIIKLGIFDYDNPQPINKINDYDGSICFPGNLGKSIFLKKLKLKHHNVYVYGPNFDTDFNYDKSVHYVGQYSPEILPKHLTQSFGLIWDGTSIKNCTGHFGQYLKYNDPHKISLYISCGIPIIIWEKAALADFVLKNGVGLTISSLEELDDLLDNIGQDEYLKMKNNVEKLAIKVRRGYYTGLVFDKIEERLI